MSGRARCAKQGRLKGSASAQSVQTLVVCWAPVKINFLARLVREPTMHFFALAAALLAVQQLVAGDGRTIVVTPALTADLVRRLQDQMGRAPSQEEADAAIEAWKTDEALYREAVHDGLDRNDPTVRSVLIGKIRERALLQTRIPEPTETELDEYLAAHRAQFETPLIYEHEYVVLPKSERATASAKGLTQRPAAERAGYITQLRAGATPASLGLRSTAANVDRERIEQTFGSEVAEKITHLPLGQWQEVEDRDHWLLVELIAVRGGLPPAEALRAQVTAALMSERQQQAVAKAVRSISERYRFEDRSR